MWGLMYLLLYSHTHMHAHLHTHAHTHTHTHTQPLIVMGPLSLTHPLIWRLTQMHSCKYFLLSSVHDIVQGALNLRDCHSYPKFKVNKTILKASLVI